MADFISRLRKRASDIHPTILYPEFKDERVIEAVKRVNQLGIANAKIVDCEDALTVSATMVAEGEADAFVAGAVYTTGEVIRAAIRRIGTAEGIKTISSAFYMVKSSSSSSESWDSPSEVLTFTDCAVVPYPTAEQLADIAIEAAKDRRRIVGDEPVVAFLSFSTKGSAKGASVNLVHEAIEICRRRSINFVVDGELQGDAALVPLVASRKAAGSEVAGRANVLVFPSLDAGNISYKLVQRLSGATAIGPILQGLSKPAADLSRGATVDDIIDVSSVTAVQTISIESL